MEDPNAAVNYVRRQQGREDINPFIIEDDPDLGTMQPRGNFTPSPEISPLIPRSVPAPPPVPAPMPPPAPSPLVVERVTETTTGGTTIHVRPKEGLWIDGALATYRGREVLLTDPEQKRIIEIVLLAEARIVDEHLSEIGVVRVNRPRGQVTPGGTKAPGRRGRPKGSKNKPKPKVTT